MRKNHSRRKLLKASGKLGAFGGLVSTGIVGRTVAQKSNSGPQVSDNAKLFRLIDSGLEHSKTTVRVRRGIDESIVDTQTLSTIGTNHPDLKGKSHEQRFPDVAADVDSFGPLSPGRYKIEVERGDLFGQTAFNVGKAGIPDQTLFKARILPNNSLVVKAIQRDGGGQV